VIVELVAGFALAGLVACQPKAVATAAGNSSFAGLGGTSWQLVEIQSMDDSQGITRPDDGSKYTISFEKDGRVAARLDCNRGIGPWKNDIANAMGGSLEIGPLAVTKALCPPPTLGETLEMQLGYVRSFTIRDGRMYLSLMADGGILVWEPMHAPK
jgi:heat shock protein HslJ